MAIMFLIHNYLLQIASIINNLAIKRQHRHQQFTTECQDVNIQSETSRHFPHQVTAKADLQDEHEGACAAVKKKKARHMQERCGT